MRDSCKTMVTPNRPDEDPYIQSLHEGKGKDLAFWLILLIVAGLALLLSVNWWTIV